MPLVDLSMGLAPEQSCEVLHYGKLISMCK